MTEKTTRAAKIKARRAPTGPPRDRISPEVEKMPIPTAPETAIPAIFS